MNYKDPDKHVEILSIARHPCGMAVGYLWKPRAGCRERDDVIYMILEKMSMGTVEGSWLARYLLC